MKTITILFTLCLFTGCGHNINTYMDGQSLDLLGVLVYRNGKVLQSNVKEHAGVTVVTVTSNTSADGVETKNDATIELTTGDQVTGYSVDLEKAKK